MKSNIWLIGLLFLVVAVPTASAQVGGVRFDSRRNTKNSSLHFSLRKSYGFYGSPFVPVGSPFFGGNFTNIVVVSPPPILVVPPPRFLLGPPLEDVVQQPDPNIGRLQIEPEPELPLPGRDAGVFRKLDADNRNRARQPIILPQEDPKRDPLPPIPERPLPPPPMKQNPADESVRQIELGKEAFARGEYGRAAERFRRAGDLAPNKPLTHLLLGQSHIALGNHRRAFDALLAGLTLDPTWPKQPFQPSDLYGDQLDYAEHQQLLVDLVTANPDDPVLLFVAGYQLWFDGRRDEARALLMRAAPVLPDPSIVDRFLQAEPNREVL